MKCKHFWFSVTQEHLSKVNKNVIDVLLSYKTIKKWACIIHDKDLYNEFDELNNPTHIKGSIKPSHWHVYVNFGTQSLDHNLLASWFEIHPSSIKRIETTSANCLLYFVHGTDEAISMGKYQYSWADVKHSPNWSPQVQAETVRFLGHFELMSYKEQLDKIYQIKDVTERIKLQEQLDKALAGELKYRSTFIDRFIQVVFVTGPAGTGKTTFARQFVEKLNYFDIVPKQYWTRVPKDVEKPYRSLDYGISGSGSDIFQDYHGEDVYILDDIRDTSFDFVDLLKFLDNHTNSSIKSRFVNKCFYGVMLVITSEQSLHSWYKLYNKSTLQQLYRRISTYVVCDKNTINLYNSIDYEGKPCGKALTIENKTKEYYKDKPKPVNVSSLIVSAFGGETVGGSKQVELTEIVDEQLPF